MNAKHTPGSMRAARMMEEIFGFEVKCPPIEYGVMLQAAAEEIDRQTAAPELLEACKAAYKMIEFLQPVVLGESQDAHEFRKDRAMVRAAIAKAQGRAPTEVR